MLVYAIFFSLQVTLFIEQQTGFNCYELLQIIACEIDLLNRGTSWLKFSCSTLQMNCLTLPLLHSINENASPGNQHQNKDTLFHYSFFVYLFIIFWFFFVFFFYVGLVLCHVELNPSDAVELVLSYTQK